MGKSTRSQPRSPRCRCSRRFVDHSVEFAAIPHRVPTHRPQHIEGRRETNRHDARIGGQAEVHHEDAVRVGQQFLLLFGRKFLQLIGNPIASALVGGIDHVRRRAQFLVGAHGLAHKGKKRQRQRDHQRADNELRPSAATDARREQRQQRGRAQRKRHHGGKQEAALEVRCQHPTCAHHQRDRQRMHRPRLDRGARADAQSDQGCDSDQRQHAPQRKPRLACRWCRAESVAEPLLKQESKAIGERSRWPVGAEEDRHLLLRPRPEPEQSAEKREAWAAVGELVAHQPRRQQ